MGKTSQWTQFATKYYRDQKSKNPDFKFSDALKGAAKLYKKGGAGDLQPTTLGGGEGEKGPMAGGRRKSRRSTGKRRTGKRSSRRQRKTSRR